ncbi:hypothetical protein ACTFIW_012621 [Dictyostelium discoideum]
MLNFNTRSVVNRKYTDTNEILENLYKKSNKWVNNNNNANSSISIEDNDIKSLDKLLNSLLNIIKNIDIIEVEKEFKSLIHFLNNITSISLFSLVINNNNNNSNDDDSDIINILNSISYSIKNILALLFDKTKDSIVQKDIFKLILRKSQIESIDDTNKTLPLNKTQKSTYEILNSFGINYFDLQNEISSILINSNESITEIYNNNLIKSTLPNYMKINNNNNNNNNSSNNNNNLLNDLIKINLQKPTIHINDNHKNFTTIDNILYYSSNDNKNKSNITTSNDYTLNFKQTLSLLYSIINQTILEILNDNDNHNHNDNGNENDNQEDEIYLKKLKNKLVTSNLCNICIENHFIFQFLLSTLKKAFMKTFSNNQNKLNSYFKLSIFCFTQSCLDQSLPINKNNWFLNNYPIYLKPLVILYIINNYNNNNNNDNNNNNNYTTINHQINGNELLLLFSRLNHERDQIVLKFSNNKITSKTTKIFEKVLFEMWFLSIQFQSFYKKAIQLLKSIIQNNNYNNNEKPIAFSQTNELLKYIIFYNEPTTTNSTLVNCKLKILLYELMESLNITTGTATGTATATATTTTTTTTTIERMELLKQKKYRFQEINYLKLFYDLTKTT